MRNYSLLWVGVICLFISCSNKDDDNSPKINTEYIRIIKKENLSADVKYTLKYNTYPFGGYSLINDSKTADNYTTLNYSYFQDKNLLLYGTQETYFYKNKKHYSFFKIQEYIDNDVSFSYRKEIDDQGYYIFEASSKRKSIHVIKRFEKQREEIMSYYISQYPNEEKAIKELNILYPTKQGKDLVGIVDKYYNINGGIFLLTEKGDFHAYNTTGKITISDDGRTAYIMEEKANQSWLFTKIDLTNLEILDSQKIYLNEYGINGVYVSLSTYFNGKYTVSFCGSVYPLPEVMPRDGSYHDESFKELIISFNNTNFAYDIVKYDDFKYPLLNYPTYYDLKYYLVNSLYKTDPSISPLPIGFLSSYMKKYYFSNPIYLYNLNKQLYYLPEPEYLYTKTSEYNTHVEYIKNHTDYQIDIENVISSTYQNIDFGETSRYQGDNDIDNITQTIKLESDHDLFSIVICNGQYDNERKNMDRNYGRINEIEIRYDSRPDLIHKVMLEDSHIMQLIPLAIQDEHSVKITIKDIYEGNSIDQPWVLDFVGVIYK
ncbi:hypothetical protein [Spirochaeta cellobiosiphila]|uniref:hypothetical protein n=1 Tax=Spirochaeta cellobiosiphila TaxID=504483 RepID=UPI000409D93F|nr:hypothetical protein [Spirochaeta cellobiosiphila]